MYSILVPVHRLKLTSAPAILPAAMLCVIVAFGFGPDAILGQEADKAVPAKTVAITEQEANDFADSLSEIAKNADVVGFNKLIDWSGMLDKALEMPKSAELDKVRQDFKRGGMMELQRTGGMVSQISAAIKQGGSYKCQRINLKDDNPYVMFRLKLPNGGGVNYHQLFLVRQAGGGIVASDMFIFLSAERMSETLRRGWLPVAKQQLKSSVEKVVTPQEPLLASILDFKKLTELVNAKKFGEALEIYYKLPAEVQKDKNALLIRMRAAQGVSEKEYGQAIDDIRKYYPNDMALDFLLIDGYTLRKQFDLALKCVERTDKNVGGDPMLQVMCANLLVKMKRVPEARKAIEDAILVEPDLSEAYASGLDVSLADQSFDETVKYLSILEKNFGYKWKDLREVPGFEEFVKSAEYREWVQTQR